MDLVYKHWEKGGKPGIEEYLKRYANKHDPFGIYWQQGMKVDEFGIMRKQDIVSKENVKKFKRLITKMGPAMGIKTSNEMVYRALIEEGERKISEMEFGTDFADKDKKLKSLRKALRNNTNQLRYEIQKTELMNHTFGGPIDNRRWKASGLGKIVKTDLASALDNNELAIRSWTKKSRFTPDTKVTASYLKGDHRMLIKEAKNYGRFFMEQMYSGVEDQESGWVQRYRKLPGFIGKAGTESGLAEQIYRLHEQGYNYPKVHAHFRSYRKQLEALAKHKSKSISGPAYKSLTALNQLLKNYTWENGLMKVPYSFTSNQKAIAGVNSAMTLWRGKGTSKYGKERIKTDKLIAGWRGYGEEGGPVKAKKKVVSTPGKLHHRIVVSDIYDVAGADESILKNVHVNVAKHDSRGAKYAPKSVSPKKPTAKYIAELVKNKEYKKLFKLFPEVAMKLAGRGKMFAMYKRL